MKTKHESECAACFHAIAVLAELCAADPMVIIDKLVDFLWTEEEAQIMKGATEPGEEEPKIEINIGPEPSLADRNDYQAGYSAGLAEGHRAKGH